MNRATPLTSLFALGLASALLVHCGSSSSSPPGAAPPASTGNPGDTTQPEAGAGGGDGGTDAAAGPSLAPMSKPRDLFAVVSGADGKIRAFGGLSTTGLETSFETYDPAANAWTLGASHATVARYGHAAAADASGNVYVIGGTSDGKTPLGSVEVYAPATDTWTTAPDLPTPRLGLAATLGKDGKIYTMGGRGADGNPSDAVEVFDPAAKSWATAAALPTKRLCVVGVTAPDGTIYAIAGRDALNTPLGVVEILDPTTGKWSTGPSLATPRYWFGATLGADGRIYATGGIGASDFLDSAEVLTPNATGGAAWTALPAMPETRGWVSAAAVKDGRVLAIGGSTDDPDNVTAQPPPMKTMVAFDPKENSWSQ
jgi:Kelch motif